MRGVPTYIKNLKGEIECVLLQRAKVTGSFYAQTGAPDRAFIQTATGIHELSEDVAKAIRALGPS